MKICQGLRPRFNTKVPQLIVHLIKRCLDANPLNRPTPKEIDSILYKWHRIITHQDFHTELYKQIKEADEFNNSLSTSIITSTSLGLSYETHSGAIYTSRLLSYSNLPEPKNSVDYYEQNDNIISMKASESLQIDFHKLKNEDNNIPEQKISDDYYEKNNNSESLQIDISQLKITDNIFSGEKNSDEYDDKQNDNMIKMESTASLSLQIDVFQLNINEDCKF
ncbi:uncharacterized protein OCT59_012442 [Rhizophagus irregularis]|uniref:uncharacterized protein n=1 Tax=Rhizophagus irregularis TaxID=588596 RepID=UPI003327643C|nr:hypothetical protein OCT59_012442 [Rhizophagus irregularis]